MRRFIQYRLACIFVLAGWIFLVPTEGTCGTTAYAQLSSQMTQTPVSGTASLIRMEKIDMIKNFDLSPERNLLIAKESGIYFAITSGQIGATNPGAKGYVDFWFVLNGDPILNSSTRQSIDPSTYVGSITTEFIFELKAGDKIGVAYTASGPSLGFIFIKPDNEPAMTSCYLSVWKID